MANAVPGPPGQGREKGGAGAAAATGSRRAVVPDSRGHPAPLRGQAEQRGEPRLCSAPGSERGRASPPPGPPARRGDGEEHCGPGRRPPGVRAGAHRPRPCGGNGCLQRGRAAGSAQTAPSRQGPSGAGRGGVRRPVPGKNSWGNPRGRGARAGIALTAAAEGVNVGWLE